MPLVTVYATLGDEAIIHSLNETEAETVITTLDLLPKFKYILPQTPAIKRIIYMEDQLKPFLGSNGYKDDVEIISFESILRKGLTSQIGRYLCSYIETNKNISLSSCFRLYTSKILDIYQ